MNICSQTFGFLTFLDAEQQYISLSLHLICCSPIHICPAPPFAFYVNRGEMTHFSSDIENRT
jgi:hypothetical protein